MTRLLTTIVACLLLLAGPQAGAATDASVASPDGNIVATISVDGNGAPHYAVNFQGQQIVAPSLLGLRFRRQAGLDTAFEIAGSQRSSRDTQWEQPWGERRLVADRHNELAVEFSSTDRPARRFRLRMRVFDDGLGFRYEVPRQTLYAQADIVDELTEFVLPTDATAWWIPAGGWNRYEFLYRTTAAGDIQRAHTPLTLRYRSGIHVSIHEAALVDYAGMWLNQRRDGVFKADLAPWSDGVRVHTDTPFRTPWRTIQVSPNAIGLLNSSLILNLNEPNVLGDVSWVKPGKYVGIWWAMHIKANSWGSGPKHGATTANTRAMIDFASAHGFDGVLVEGWNTGWDGDWFYNGDLFSFVTPYPDFDLEEIAAYAKLHGVRLIGHHETSGNVTNYENQMAAAYDLYQSLGVSQVKTGYVADGGNIKRVDEQGVAHYEWHDGQFTIGHYLRSVTEAAKRRISINTHEPVKDTGLRRTYPNWLSREGARGQEFNAWGSPPNPPEHTAILPFTRMLAGPMDFTPGIFDLKPNGPDDPNRVQTTLAKQLALYVVLYSPIQMAADLPANYLARPDAFQFIVDVPTDWEQSVALAGEVGDYVVFARQGRNSADWFLGALTDETARKLVVPLKFLDVGESYQATIYRDGDGAHWQSAPYAFTVETRTVDSTQSLGIELAAGGGSAVRFMRTGKQ